jgi:hypothetical protein
MNREQLINFIQEHGTESDKANLSVKDDFTLRSIVQRLFSEINMNGNRERS